MRIPERGTGRACGAASEGPSSPTGVSSRRGFDVEASDLHFCYGAAPLFEGLSFSVRSGEMVGLIGANGCGKTTLLRLLSGVLEPRSGAVRIGGRPVTSIPQRERARMIGVVPQESRLTFDFSALEVVLMGRTAHAGLLGLESAADREAVRRAMERTGTLPFTGRFIGRLSGGERQLVFVARALAQEPGLLLLDEPTAFLDIRHRLEIYGILRELNARDGLTIVITSHDINLAARFCPRLILLKQGRIVADGATPEVFREEVLEEVYGTALRVIRDPDSGEGIALPPRQA